MDIYCPLCQCNKIKILLNLNAGNFDNSKLYQKIKICSCSNCGNIFNGLTHEEYDGIIDYYNNEYAPANIGGASLGGDRPGSRNEYTENRHKELYNLFKPSVQSNIKILDIGCAMGGMLSFLYDEGFRNLYGIDLTTKYLNIAKENKNLKIEFGSAEEIPFEDNCFDLLIIDQVMEHLINPRKAFQEAKRVLKKDGLFCIGVPNAEKYSELYFFDFYWFLMREHIQHFDLTHLEFLANSEGFELVNFSFTNMPMMSEKMILPNLNVVFRYTGVIKNTKQGLKKDYLSFDIERYIRTELAKLNRKKEIFYNLMKKNIPIYIWGIGREFFYLYENSDLRNCNIKKLLDSNKYKQEMHTVYGMKVSDTSKISLATKDSILIITAIAHKDAIQKIAIQQGFKGTIIDIDEEKRKCPSCGNLNHQLLFDFQINNFDKYQLLKDIRITRCKKCGFILNDIVNEIQLNQFYTQESQYHSGNSFGTGGVNNADKQRYDLYENLLSKYINKNSYIYDIGCAKGGLIQHFNSLGYMNTAGIEINKELVNIAKSLGLNVQEGNATDIPLSNNEADVLIFSHVFEHLLEFEKTVTSICRVLKNEGLLFVEVPNANEYFKYPVFDFFWLGIREHINHFSKNTLNGILAKYGFEMIEALETNISYDNKKYSYPSLICIFRKTKVNKIEKNLDEVLHQNITAYLQQEYTKVFNHAKSLMTIFSQYQSIYFWGIGQEFFILSSFVNLEKYRSQILLIDKDEFKQKNHTFLGLDIHSPEIIENIDLTNSLVIICSVFNYENINKQLNNNIQRVCINEL